MRAGMSAGLGWVLCVLVVLSWTGTCDNAAPAAVQGSAFCSPPPFLPQIL
eukprot:CAMPEP_0114173178 /NCGR_PEP_ID=MMETSP0043_2-20121206/35697_1 /TAXON_ID=464988 /ORGANISM="Hemiselmis andersenii, Strain CCMP644" /LENGTH=49 /DNA_ID= /DNA_START= /DNA_END= /DNA_ORIENTATION=